MLRALHQAVVQNANLSLVHIRNLEVAYFTNFFLNFSIKVIGSARMQKPIR